MKQTGSYEVKEFTYESKTKRNYHVAEMEQEGWEEDGRTKRLRDGVSIMDANKDDYEWFARFQRTTI